MLLHGVDAQYFLQGRSVPNELNILLLKLPPKDSLEAVKEGRIPSPPHSPTV